MRERSEPPTSVEVELTDGEARIAVRGDLDFRGSGILRERLQEARRAEPRRIALGLSEVTFLDSAGVSILIQARERCNAEGVEFAIVSSSEAVTRTLRITGVDGALRIEG